MKENSLGEGVGVNCRDNISFGSFYINRIDLQISTYLSLEEIKTFDVQLPFHMKAKGSFSIAFAPYNSSADNHWKPNLMKVL